MACDCIATIEAQKPKHRVDTAIMFGAGNTLVARTFSALIRRDNGRKETRRDEPSLIAHNFCPFCGVKHEDELKVVA